MLFVKLSPIGTSLKPKRLWTKLRRIKKSDGMKTDRESLQKPASEFELLCLHHSTRLHCYPYAVVYESSVRLFFRLEDKVAEAEKQYKAMQKKIVKCTEELNKRIFEHDQAIGQGFENKELLVQVCLFRRTYHGHKRFNILVRHTF